MAGDEWDRNSRGGARGVVPGPRDQAAAELLGRRFHQFLSLCVGVLRRAPIYGIDAECLLCRHAVYGFRQWQRGRGGAALVVCRWPIAPHLAGVLGIAVLSWVSSYFLRRYTPAAWPLVDSMVTWSSVFATFLVARKVYENWHWWLVIDSVSLCLYFTKHLYLTTLLFGLYLVLIVLGMRQWRNSLLSTASTAGPAGTHAAGHARAHARG